MIHQGLKGLGVILAVEMLQYFQLTLTTAQCRVSQMQGDWKARS